MHDPVRAAVLAGHEGDVERAAGLAMHPDAAVRAAALGALERMGALAAPMLVTALTDAAPAVRRRACALAGRRFGAGRREDGVLDAVVHAVSADPDPAVVEGAAWALGEAGSDAGAHAVGSLQHVASAHDDPLCREAAVAALGAVGDPAALDTVLNALEDKPAVRRRATIALAAFDDPRVDGALQRCLEDRDWQVRQAAEDLLGRI